MVYRPSQFGPPALRLGQVAAGESINRRVHYDEYATTAGELPPDPKFSITALQHDPIRLSVGSPILETLGAGLIRRRTPIDVSFTAANRGGYTEVFLAPDGSAGPLAASGLS